MVSPIGVQKALSGIDHPASKQQIVEHAEKSGGGADVLDALQGSEDREYEGPSGVSSAVFD
ncbi:DUF2795 domain-containing protein [Geodermatophilus sabuli]|uniref:DUF2795 domain-containing protein n=1 Tax=Geodermatophilus sabuli TaxID=1564158 RepID=A0A7K3W094_9ACTN|nr:DUF2795 domain-containing protein [Geodermatophilus sabuli]NEK57327.1 DUF2795 domain-containing protein [Geodermatophilus sabuli]